MARSVLSEDPDSRARLDSATLALAVLLFVSPWLLDFSGLAVAEVTAWVGAVLIAFGAVAAMRRFAAWQEWLICLTAAGLVIAPWALDFRYLNSSTAAFVGVGSFVLVIAIANLWRARRASRGLGAP